MKNDLGFSNTSTYKDMIFKTSFIITLRYIKYELYSLIGSNYIMHLHIMLHIHLHSSNMHALLQRVPKHQYGNSPVNHQLSLTIHF